MQPAAYFRIPRGNEPTEAHLVRVRAGLNMAHATDTPAFFWYPDLNPNWLADLKSVHTQRAGAELGGRGRRWSLAALAQAVDQEHGARVQPITATQALQGGLDATAGGRALLRRLSADLNILLCVENGLLLSTNGLITPCHLHAGGVLNIYLASCSWNTAGPSKEKRLVVQTTQADSTSQGKKQYIMISASSMEEANIGVYDTTRALELAVVLLRIASLDEPARQGIRWWHGALDGSTVNALIWPPTTYHWVYTSQKGNQGWVYAGLATQYIPLNREHQLRADAELQRRYEGITRPVIERPHLSMQPSSVYAAEALRDLIDGTPGHLIRSWHETESLRTMDQALAAAPRMMAAKDFAGVTKTLGSALQAMKDAGGGEASHSRAEELIALAQHELRGNQLHGSPHAGEP